MGDEDGGHQHGSVQAGGEASASPRAAGINGIGEGSPSSAAAAEAEAAPPSAEPVIAASRWSVTEPGDDYDRAEGAGGSATAGASRAGKRGRVAAAAGTAAAAGALSASDLDILRELDSELQMPPSAASITASASASAKRSKKLRRVWWPDQQQGSGEDGGEEGDGGAEAGFSVRTSKKVGVPWLGGEGDSNAEAGFSVRTSKKVGVYMGVLGLALQICEWGLRCLWGFSLPPPSCHARGHSR